MKSSEGDRAPISSSYGHMTINPGSEIRKKWDIGYQQNPNLIMKVLKRREDFRFTISSRVDQKNRNYEAT